MHGKIFPFLETFHNTVIEQTIYDYFSTGVETSYFIIDLNYLLESRKYSNKVRALSIE